MMKEQNNIYPSIIQTIGLLVSLFVLNIVIEIVNRVFLLEIFNSDFLDFIRTLISGGSVLLFVFFVKKRRGGDNFILSLKTVDSKVYFWIFLISPFYIFFILGIVVLTYALFTNLTLNAATINYQINSYTFISLVCLAPILEEILFRGIILDGFLHRYSHLKAIFLSAFFFSILHFGPQIVSAMVLGLMTGCLYYYTTSVFPGMLLHALNNLFSFIVIYFFNDDIISKGLNTILQSVDISAIGISWGVNTFVLLILFCHFIKRLKLKYK